MQPLRSTPWPTPPPPVDRGPLLSADAVAARLNQVADLGVTARWVKTNVRPRVRLSARKLAWYTLDVDTWLASRREDTA